MYTKFINAVLVAGVLVVSLIGSASAKEEVYGIQIAKSISELYGLAMSINRVATGYGEHGNLIKSHVDAKNVCQEAGFIHARLSNLNPDPKNLMDLHMKTVEASILMRNGICGIATGIESGDSKEITHYGNVAASGITKIGEVVKYADSLTEIDYAAYLNKIHPIDRISLSQTLNGNWGMGESLWFISFSTGEDGITKITSPTMKDEWVTVEATGMYSFISLNGDEVTFEIMENGQLLAESHDGAFVLTRIETSK